MSSFGSQSSNVESETRYGDLLHPCSDINKNWAINIAEILRKYLNELASINVEIRNGEVTLNFAEAALLIQGSTSIFSKKVEYLYSLANQLLLQLHNEKKENSAAAKMKDTILLGRDSSEFGALDNISKSNNLNLNDDMSNTQKKIGVQKVPMIPLELIPLDSNEKGDVILMNMKGEDLGKKNDYQLNLCSIHSSGCLLLPTVHYDFSSEPYPSDIHSEVCDMEAGESDSEDMSPPELFPLDQDDMSDGITTPSRNSSRNDEQPPILTLACENFVEASQETEDNILPRRRSVRQVLKQKALEEKQKKEEINNKSAWDVSEDKQPELRKQIQKKNIKRLPRKLTRKRPVNTTTEEERNNNSTLNFCSKNFFGVENKCLKKGAFAVNKLYLNEAFQQLVIEQYKKQQEILQKCRKKLKLEEEVGVKEEPCQLNQDSDVDDDDLGIDALPNDDDDNLLENGSGNSDPNRNIECGSPLNSVSATSNEDAPCTYEELVRKHVENYMKDVAQFCQTSELSQKVNQWEGRIKPILENENKREIFNIHIYGTRIIDKFEDNNRKQTLAFHDICRGKRRWEVCRYFLASLQLANSSNVEISTSRKQNGLHDIEFTLLSRKRHQEQLDEFGHNCGEH